jgi:four helix bundle protein
VKNLIDCGVSMVADSSTYSRFAPAWICGFSPKSVKRTVGVARAFYGACHEIIASFRYSNSPTTGPSLCTGAHPAFRPRSGLACKAKSGVPVAANIVEGSARDGEADFLRFLDIALGSARECGYLIGLANRLDFLDNTSTGKLDEFARRTQAALIALKKSIRPRTLRP